MEKKAVEDLCEVGAVGGLEYNERADVKENKTCEPCLTENVNEVATAFCTVCIEYLCINCVREHRKNKILRNHQILEGTELPEDASLFKCMKSMMACSDHPEVDITHKCEDHNQYICVTCLANNHRRCQEVTELGKDSASVSKDKSNTVKETISDLRKCAESSEDTTKANIKRLLLQQADVECGQKLLFEKIDLELSKRKQQLELETKQIVTTAINEFDRYLLQCKNAEIEGEKYQKLLDLAQRFGNAKEVQTLPDLVLKKVRVLQDSVDLESEQKPVEIEFTSSFDMKSVEKLGQVSLKHFSEVSSSSNTIENLGSDEIVEQKESTRRMATEFVGVPLHQQCSGEETHDSKTTHAFDQKTFRQDQKYLNRSFMERNIKQQGALYSVGCAEDRLSCQVYGIVILPDEKVVILDNNNQKLKVFEDDFSLLYTYSLDENPHDMCHVKEMTVAVAFLDKKKIEKYVVGSNIHFNGMFSTKYLVVALATFGINGNIAILFSEISNENCENLFIQIRDGNKGCIYETFRLEKSPGVAFRFEEGLSNRLVCRGTREILLSEFRKFHCFDKDGSDHNCMQESWFYKSQKGRPLQDISDIALDEEGNVYVCGCKSENIHQISADTYRNNRVVVRNIRKPFSLAVNSNKGYLVVGCEDDDYLHVYQFLT